MEVLETVVGLIALYTWIHFGFIQHATTWENRSTYERMITVLAIVLFTAVLMGLE